MGKYKKKAMLFLALAMAAVVSLSGCAFIEKSKGAIAKEKVAKVGNHYITRGELDQIYNYAEQDIKEQLKASDSTKYTDQYFSTQEGKDLLNGYKKEVLNDMIQDKVIEEKATELKLFKDENEIKTETKKIIDKIKEGKTDDEFKKWMSDNKLSDDLLNKLARTQVIRQKVAEYATKDVTVSDDEIKKYYNDNPYSFTEKPDTMAVSHILVGENDLNLAKTIKQKLDKGEDFAALAKQYSTDSGTNKQGGSLGEVQYNDPNYDSDFMKAAMALKEGQVSEPVKSQYGYHIIKVTKKTEYPVKPLDKVKDDIKTTVLNQKKQQKYEADFNDWYSKAKIQTYDKNISNSK